VCQSLGGCLNSMSALAIRLFSLMLLEHCKSDVSLFCSWLKAWKVTSQFLDFRHLMEQMIRNSIH